MAAQSVNSIYQRSPEYKVFWNSNAQKVHDHSPIFPKYSKNRHKLYDTKQIYMKSKSQDYNMSLL